MRDTVNADKPLMVELMFRGTVKNLIIYVVFAILFGVAGGLMVFNSFDSINISFVEVLNRTMGVANFTYLMLLLLAVGAVVLVGASALIRFLLITRWCSSNNTALEDIPDINETDLKKLF